MSTYESDQPRIIKAFQRFFKKEALSSLILISMAVIAFAWANGPFADTYRSFWHVEISVHFGQFHISKSLVEWIDEGLMTLFFLLVGLEIKREILVGELVSLKRAMLPVSAALGGMIFPALIYTAFNKAEPTAVGWGIPMATDIAFSLGLIYVLGKRIPLGLRVFLTAFAIVDDIGAALVIALFYSKGIVIFNLLVVIFIMILMILANYLSISNLLIYTLFLIINWVFMMGSGVHPTLAGIITAFFIPARGRYDTDKFLEEVSYYLSTFRCPPEGCGYTILYDQRHQNAVKSIELACHDVETPLQRVEHILHPWVAFLIIPLFALANAGVTIDQISFKDLFFSPLSKGIIGGLVIGKPLGILLFSYLAYRFGVASLPAGVRWFHILGAGMLGGVGFTMSLFVSGLSFHSPYLKDLSKMSILIASVLSALLGLTVLYLYSLKSKKTSR